MAKKTVKKEFKGKWIVINLALAAGVVVALVVSAMIFLNIVTKHNQELIVPDFSNMTLAEADSVATMAGMRIDVTDSVFVKRMQRGSVYRQNPIAGSKVKSGRRISLTINAVNAREVKMPNLVGYSMRQARAELVSRGLVLGKLVYVNDKFTNNVLRQLVDGREIEPGTPIESESVVDLVVGLNPSDDMTFVPLVTGMKRLNAQDAIHDHSLNVKKMVFDRTVKDFNDSLSAVVYKQTPDTSALSVKMGSEMVLYLTLDENKIPKKVEDESAGN